MYLYQEFYGKVLLPLFLKSHPHKILFNPYIGFYEVFTHQKPELIPVKCTAPVVRKTLYFMFAFVFCVCIHQVKNHRRKGVHLGWHLLRSIS